MKRTLRIIIALILFALLPSMLMAQGESTLEGLAGTLAKLIQRQDDFEARLIEIENRLNIVTAEKPGSAYSSLWGIFPASPRAPPPREP